MQKPKENHCFWRSRGGPGGVLGPFGGVLGPLEGVLRPLEGILEPPGAVVGASWAAMRRLGSVLGASWDRVGAILGPLEGVLVSWGRLESFVGRLGGVLGRLGVVLVGNMAPTCPPKRSPNRSKIED